MKSETTGEGKLNTIDKVTEQANVRNDVVEDKRSLTYYLLQPPSRLLITPITHCHMTRNTNKLNGLRMN
jgi:hypothetical protein